MAIQSFSDKNAEEFFITGYISKGIGWANASQIAKRKLDVVHWRVIFRWLESGPSDVRITDYH